LTRDSVLLPILKSTTFSRRIRALWRRRGSPSSAAGREGSFCRPSYVSHLAICHEEFIPRDPSVGCQKVRSPQVTASGQSLPRLSQLQSEPRLFGNRMGRHLRRRIVNLRNETDLSGTPSFSVPQHLSPPNPDRKWLVLRHIRGADSPLWSH
jgi:hypothetical protein